MTPDAPTTLGPYRIVRALGRGGMGVVYEAIHDATGERVACKTVKVVRAGQLASLRREIHALAALRHPGIVRILEHGVEGGIPWYAMELCAGETLRAHVRTVAAGNAGNALIAALAILRRLCHALAYLHGEGIVHRDLKPDNVVVGSGGWPVLLDFGLAAQSREPSSRDALQVDAEAMGTVWYVAPEQARGDPVDARADLYALGCILYEIATGRPPHIGGSAFEVLAKSFAEPPLPPSSIVRALPPELDAIALGLLAARPKERIGHAADVAAMLGRLLPGDDAAIAAMAPPRAYLYRPGLSGRKGALKELTAKLQALRDGEGGLVLLSGESGVGKTRLAMALAMEARRIRVRVMTGDCALHSTTPEDGAGGGPALRGFHGVLGAIADHCREIGAGETERILGRRGRILAPYASALADLPAVMAHPEPLELPPAEARARLLAALATTLHEACGGRPMLLVLDDLQWADDLTLDALAHLHMGDHLRRGPILVVATYRTEELSAPLRALRDLPGASLHALGRLGDDAVAEMVGDMLAIAPPPAPFCAFLARHSEGNPFFVSEYLRLAIGLSVLERDAAGRWTLGRSGALESLAYDELPLPHTLHELVERRLGALSTAARRLVDGASVLGREVDAALWQALEDGADEGGFLTAVTELLERQVIEEARSGLYRFAHDKLREVAYATLGAPARASLHAGAARALEETYGDKPGGGDHAAAIAHHWHRAGDVARARASYLVAATVARGKYAMAEAARLYRAYLSLCDAPSVESIRARGDFAVLVLRDGGKTTEAEAEIRIAIQESLAIGDAVLVAKNTEAMAFLLRLVGRMAESEERYREALALHETAGDARERAITRSHFAILLQDTGRMDEALAHYEEALAEHKRLGGRRFEATILGNIATLHHEQGRVREARELYKKAIALSRELGERRFEASQTSNLGMTSHELGDLAEAIALNERSLAIYREMGDLFGEGATLGNIAMLHQELGHAEDARRLYDAALANHRETGNRRFEAIVLTNLAILDKIEKRLDVSEETCRRSLLLHREVKSPRFEAYALSTLASILMDRGRLEEAEEACRASLQILEPIEDGRLQASALMTLAGIERRAARYGDAQKHARAANQLLESIGEYLDRGAALCELGHVALANGRPAVAELREIETLFSLAPPPGGGPMAAAIDALRAANRDFESGVALVHGERAADAPPAMGRTEGSTA